MRTVTTLLVAVLGATSLSCRQAPDRDLRLQPERFSPPLREAVTQVRDVYEKYPSDAAVLYQVAALHARAGHREDAVSALARMAAARAGVHPRLRDGFDSLATDSSFLALLQRIRQENPPARNAVSAFSIDEGDLGPEGIAWSERRRTLYLGSIKRKILAVSPSGDIRELVAPRSHGLGAVAGVRVDDTRGELWAASAAFGPSRDAVVSGIFRFDLRDGGLRGVHPIDTAGGAFVNDIAVAPDGTAYATVTTTGALLRVRRTTAAPEVFLPPGSLPDPNGIAVTTDGRYALVAGWHGIIRVDLGTREAIRLRQPSHVASGCLDGLYLSGSTEIIGVQNCVHETGRILRFRTTPRLDAIVSVEVLESYNPVFDGITTAAIAGDSLYFVANVQLRKHAAGGSSARAFDPIRVLRLPLAPRRGS